MEQFPTPEQKKLLAEFLPGKTKLLAALGLFLASFGEAQAQEGAPLYTEREYQYKKEQLLAMAQSNKETYLLVDSLFEKVQSTLKKRHQQEDAVYNIKIQESGAHKTEFARLRIEDGKVSGSIVEIEIKDKEGFTRMISMLDNNRDGIPERIVQNQDPVIHGYEKTRENMPLLLQDLESIVTAHTVDGVYTPQEFSITEINLDMDIDSNDETSIKHLDFNQEKLIGDIMRGDEATIPIDSYMQIYAQVQERLRKELEGAKEKPEPILPPMAAK